MQVPFKEVQFWFEPHGPVHFSTKLTASDMSAHLFRSRLSGEFAEPLSSSQPVSRPVPVAILSHRKYISRVHIQVFSSDLRCTAVNVVAWVAIEGKKAYDRVVQGYGD